MQVAVPLTMDEPANLPLFHNHETVEVMGRVLDGLEVAMCLFDAQHRTVLWNRTFLRFFPEHAGLIHSGEPYRRNLERFYRTRLNAEEMHRLPDYVESGIARHQAQTRPFSFDHRGRHLCASSLPLPDGSRIRMWKALIEPPGALTSIPVATDPFAYLADGAMILDSQGRIVAVNQEFLELYDLFSAESVMGLTFRDVVRATWQGQETGGRIAQLDAFLDNARFAGAAFEVELPGDRWRRVIERRMEDGTSYISHADITALKRQQQELREAYVRIAELAMTDGLTGVANRTRFEAALAEEVARADRDGHPLSVLLIDIDHFKRINDRFGHVVGDECLRIVSRLIKDHLRRPADLAARFGGEEFAAILPDTDADGAHIVAEAIRAAIAANRAHLFNAARPVTVSIGVATVLPGSTEGADWLTRRADEALYRAKHAGRNRVAS